MRKGERGRGKSGEVLERFRASIASEPRVLNKRVRRYEEGLERFWVETPQNPVHRQLEVLRASAGDVAGRHVESGNYK